MKRFYTLMMNFFSFWLHRYYDHIIWSPLAWELAKIHTDHSMQWDAMVIIKDGSTELSAK